MDSSDTVSLIESCLVRHGNGDPSAWNDLITHTFERLLHQCNRIVRQELSKPNPLITENVVLAETYFRLRKAMRSDQVRPMTAREFFGLAARNIRWQVQDMVRKPAHQQETAGVLDGLSQGQDIAAEVIDREKWRRFWDTVDALRPDEREVFDLIWINGLSQYEAAELLGVTRNQIDSLWRGIKRGIAESCRDFIPEEFREPSGS